MMWKRLSTTASLAAVLLLVIVALVPVALAIALSFERRILVFHEARFVGLDNYAFSLRDARFWSALGHTAYFALVAVSLEMALGLAFAVLLDAAVRGRGLLRAAVLIPWAIPTVVSAKLWAWLFSPDYGLVTRLLPLSDVNLLGMPGWAMHAAIVVDVWKTTPFVALLLLAGLQTIPHEVYEAARVDGSSHWRTYLSITLPLLRPALIVATLINVINVFNSFPIIWEMTRGGPGYETSTTTPFMYLLKQSYIGESAAISVINFGIVIVIVALVIVNAALGYVQERRAAEATEALRDVLAGRARVLRGGRIGDVLTDDVVVGDVLVLAAGDRVAADARILSSDGLEELGVMAPDLFQNSWVNQLTIDDLEVKMNGAFSSIEFDDEGTISVSFVPIRPGNYSFYSPGFEKAGLTGTFVVR